MSSASARGEALRHVQVHLALVKYGVVWGGSAQIEAEGAPVQDLGHVAHGQ